MYEQFVQSMPIQLIAPWRNPTPSPNNDLELSMDINANGIKEPIIIGVGVFSRKIRLETGNHRIYLCPRMGMTHLPCVARVWNYCTFNNGNGDHAFDCPEITVKKQWLEKEYYAKPSDVLDIMALMLKM
jgi:hypothetical protein